MLVASIPLVLVNNHSSVIILTVAYILRMIGNAFVFSPALSEAFSELSQEENSHGTALNNTLRQVSGAVSVTLCVVIANTPASLVSGIRYGMWSTVIMVILMILSFYHYLNIKKANQK